MSVRNQRGRVVGNRRSCVRGTLLLRCDLQAGSECAFSPFVGARFPRKSCKLANCSPHSWREGGVPWWDCSVSSRSPRGDGRPNHAANGLAVPIPSEPVATLHHELVENLGGFILRPAVPNPEHHPKIERHGLNVLSSASGGVVPARLLPKSSSLLCKHRGSRLVSLYFQLR